MLVGAGIAAEGRCPGAAVQCGAHCQQPLQPDPAAAGADQRSPIPAHSGKPLRIELAAAGMSVRLFASL